MAGVVLNNKNNEASHHFCLNLKFIELFIQYPHGLSIPKNQAIGAAAYRSVMMLNPVYAVIDEET